MLTLKNHLSPSPALQIGIVVRSLLRAGIGAIFIFAGSQKIIRPYEFLDAVYQYSIIGPITGAFLAATLPAIEVGIGTFLLLDLCTPFALAAASLACVFFLTAQGIVLKHDVTATCGCFGSTSTVGAPTIIRTGALLLICLILLSKELWSPKVVPDRAP